MADIHWHSWCSRHSDNLIDIFETIIELLINDFLVRKVINRLLNVRILGTIGIIFEGILRNIKPWEILRIFRTIGEIEGFMLRRASCDQQLASGNLTIFNFIFNCFCLMITS